MHMRQILSEMTTYLTCPANKHGFRSNVNLAAGTERLPFPSSVRHAPWHCLAIANRSILLKCSTHDERGSSIFLPCANTWTSTRLPQNESIEYTGRKKHEHSALTPSSSKRFLLFSRRHLPFFRLFIHHHRTHTHKRMHDTGTNERTSGQRERE